MLIRGLIQRHAAGSFTLTDQGRAVLETLVMRLRTMAKRPRCAYSKKAFTPAKHGLQRYCCQAHRQRAYVRGRRAEGLPSLLLGRDIDDRRWRAEVERIVMDVLRRLDVLPQLRIVKSDEDNTGGTRH
jgi:hypothetical protein